MLSLLLSTAASATPGTRVDLEMREVARDGAAATRVEHAWITADRVRVEDGTQIRIYDAGAGRYVALDRPTKTWYEQERHALADSSMVSADAYFGISIDEATGGPRVPSQVFRRTGRTHEWQDRDAAEWVATEPDVEGATDHLWMAPESIGWKDLLRVVHDVYCERDCALDPWYAQAEALPGWPVRIQRVADDGTQTTTVTAIEAVDVPDAAFDVPAGWTRVADPAGLSDVR